MRQIGIKYSTFMRRRDSNMEHEKTNEYSLNLIDLFCVDQWKAWKILFTSLDNIVSWMTSRGTSVTRVISSVYNGSTMDLQWIYNGTRQTISSATLHFTPVTLSQYHFDVHCAHLCSPTMVDSRSVIGQKSQDLIPHWLKLITHLHLKLRSAPGHHEPILHNMDI